MHDLTELATKLPDVAEAVIDLYRRFRQADDQLAEIVGDRDAGRPAAARTTRSRDFFYRRQNYVPALDEAAEELAGRHRRPRAARSSGALRDRLADPARRADRPAKIDRPARPAICTATAPAPARCTLSASLRPGQQAIRMGAQIACWSTPT